MDKAGDQKQAICTDVDIRKRYWPYWRKKMRQKWGRKHKLITFNNCVDDWVSINWATELGSDKEE
jgi:hypothetical protein